MCGRFWAEMVRIRAGFGFCCNNGEACLVGGWIALVGVVNWGIGGENVEDAGYIGWG